MATNPEDVKRLAELARVDVPDTDLAAFAAEFDGKLDELTLPEGDTVLPEVRNVFRADGVPTPPGTWTEAIVAQFPEKDENYLSVKQIITHD